MRAVGLFFGVVLVSACADEPVADAPPDETPQIVDLCLSIDQTQIDFAAAQPGAEQRQTVFVSACDGQPLSVSVDLEGEGFVVIPFAIDGDGATRYGVSPMPLVAGERLAVDIVFLARSSDDGAEAKLEVRGTRPGAIGLGHVGLSGTIEVTCEECGCCDTSIESDTAPVGGEGPSGSGGDGPDYHDDDGQQPAGHHPCSSGTCGPPSGGGPPPPSPDPW